MGQVGEGSVHGTNEADVMVKVPPKTQLAPHDGVIILYLSAVSKFSTVDCSLNIESRGRLRYADRPN